MVVIFIQKIKIWIYAYLSIFLYYVVHLLPRCKNKWVFSGGANSKYFFFELQQRCIHQKIFLILSDKEEVEKMKQHYPNTLYLHSFTAYFQMLTSSVFFLTVDLEELSFIAAGGATKVNLWHGVGIKKIGAINNFDKKDLSMKVYNFKKNFHRGYLSLHPDWLLSTSPMMDKHFASCFRINQEQCIDAMYPRCSFLLHSQEYICEYLRKIQDIRSLQLIDLMQKYDKVFLYMPTWRDSGADIIRDAGFNFEKLDDVLQQKNYLFLLKLHPNTNLDINSLSDFDNIICLDKSLDIYPIMPFTSMLITDYSSIYYDYLLMPDKEILLYPFDEEEYLNQCRDFAFDYKIFTPGKRIYTFSELLNIIYTDVSCILETDQINMVLDSFWKWNFDLYEKIKEKLK